MRWGGMQYKNEASERRSYRPTQLNQDEIGEVHECRERVYLDPDLVSHVRA
jgi:hypothetical protein